MKDIWFFRLNTTGTIHARHNIAVTLCGIVDAYGPLVHSTLDRLLRNPDLCSRCGKALLRLREQGEID